jgi:flagella basal body P-ring formation protein FlgA
MIMLLGSLLLATAQAGQGELALSGNTYDLAIDGAGFFRLVGADGEQRFTRDGRFHLDPTGVLVSAGGLRLDPPVTIPARAISCVIGFDGRVQVLLEGAPSLVKAGEIRLARFADEGALLADPGGRGRLLRATSRSGAGALGVPGQEGTGFLRQGYLEREGLSATEASGEVTITFPMEARVRGTEVELGEVAHVQCSDPALARLVGGFELGYAPAPGYSRVFRVERVRSALARKMPNVLARFAGQRACRVYPEVQEISGEEILAAARRELEAGMGDQEITFQPTGELEAVAVPAGATSHSVRARLENRPTSSGFVTVPVEILVDETRYRTIWTPWRVSVWHTRPVLAQDVRAGEILRPQMFERRRVEALAGESPALVSGLLVGSVALRDLPAGALVRRSDVQRPTVVALGDSVFLRVKKGAIEARVSAVALQAGAIGDRIRVQTGDSAQELVATIESRETCRIDLDRP